MTGNISFFKISWSEAKSAVFRFKLKIKFSAQKMMISANRFSALKKLFFESLISIVECGLKKRV